MNITGTELNEFFIPRLDWLRVGIRHCKNQKCEKAVNEIQEWIDTKLKIEEVELGALKYMKPNKDWNGKP